MNKKRMDSCVRRGNSPAAKNSGANRRRIIDAQPLIDLIKRSIQALETAGIDSSGKAELEQMLYEIESQPAVCCEN